MEAANESARHAVNAILDHYLYRNADGGLEAPGDRGGAPREPYNGQRARPTPIGDYCRIWDPERHEPPDFERFKQLDEVFFRSGLAHPWEVIGSDLPPTLLPSASGPYPRLEALLAGPAGRRGAAEAGVGAEALLRVLTRICEGLEEALDRTRREAIARRQEAK